MLHDLEQAVLKDCPANVESEMLKLTFSDRPIPEGVPRKLLQLLKSDRMFKSQSAAHLLNFFEFEADKLSDNAKQRCSSFLREWGGEFEHVHAVQVVAELVHGSYLKVDTE